MLLLLAGCSPLAVHPRPSDPHAFNVVVEGSSEVTCESGDDVRSMTVDGRGVLRGLLADREYTCTSSTGEVASARTDPLPDDLPVPEVLIPADDVGWFLLSINDEGHRTGPGEVYYAMVLDEEGRVRWYQEGLGGGDVDLSWLGNGLILYGGTSGHGRLAPTIIDLDGNVAWEAENTLVTEGDGPDGWNHDCGLSADATSVYALVDEASGGRPEYGFIVKQFAVPGGELLWSWASSEHADALPIDPVSSEPDDPWHANAVWDAEEADGAKVYVSLRKVSRVLKIDRTSGDIEWMVGSGGDFTLRDEAGVELPDTEWFYGQHDAKVIDGRLSVFDNGTWRPEHGGEDYSRIVAMDLDEDTYTATLTTAWTESRDGHAWKAEAWGGADPLADGGWSVANGAFWYEHPPEFHSAASILDPDGTVAWRVEWADPSIGLYRTDRVPVGFGIE